jgi:hypothetical protein
VNPPPFNVKAVSDSISSYVHMSNCAHDDAGNTVAILKDSQEVLILANDLTSFVIHAINKYLKGQLEHGGHISERDLDVEISQEITDLFFYHQANKRKQKKK